MSTREEPFILTYTGQRVSATAGAPTVKDIAVQLGRTPRWRGATKTFYPVLAHSLVVAHLLPREYRLHGLLHDAGEVVVGDFPAPLKPLEVQVMEQAVLVRIYKSLGLDLPGPKARDAVMMADHRARVAEAYVLGPPGIASCPGFEVADSEATTLTKGHIPYKLDDCLNVDGEMVRFFEERFNELIGVHIEGVKMSLFSKGKTIQEQELEDKQLRLERLKNWEWVGFELRRKPIEGLDDPRLQPIPAERPSWATTYMEVADTMAKRSTCLRRHVGAVLVKDTHIIATGFNGAPARMPHCRTCIREEAGIPSGERHEICRGVHSEMNLIIQAAIHGRDTRGAEVYVTCSPCTMCAKILVNAGVEKVVYQGDYPDKMALEILNTGGVAVENYPAG